MSVVLTVADRPAELGASRRPVSRSCERSSICRGCHRRRRSHGSLSVNHAVTKLGSRFEGDLAGWRPDVVHGHDWQLGWAADSLASQYDVPFVLTMHGTERVRHGGQLPPVIRSTSPRSNGGPRSRPTTPSPRHASSSSSSGPGSSSTSITSHHSQRNRPLALATSRCSRRARAPTRPARRLRDACSTRRGSRCWPGRYRC